MLSQDDDNPDLMAGNLGRKRIKSQGQTGNDRRKCRRITAGEGLANVATSMEKAMQTLAGSISQASASVTQPALHVMDPTSRQAAAVTAIEEDEGLSDNELNDAVVMIMGSADTANMYLALKGSGSRTRFLQHQLSKFRGLV